MEKGTINVIKKHSKKSISDVKFVPALKHNLISVGQLSQKGYRVIFEKNLCTIFDMPPSNMVIARVEMTNNRMFPLWMKSNMTDEVAASQDQKWIWHLRYGHLNLKGLSLPQKKEMVRGLPPIEASLRPC